MASGRDRRKTSPVGWPVGTLPRNGFCCCPARELGVVLLAAGLMVRGVAILPSSKELELCCATANLAGTASPATMIMICTLLNSLLLSWFSMFRRRPRVAERLARQGHHQRKHG